MKLYGEACIIGLKDYPFYYDNMSERTPMMIGFNFPTFKILDLLNIEGEYYSSRISTDYHNQVQPPGAMNRIFVTPIPAAIADNIPETLKWKWSIYLKKTLAPRTSIILQFAHDHYRVTYPDGNPFWTETLPHQGDWRWVVKLVGVL